eukprot:COSAG01_NODE_60179_length_296_cov_0.685279_1_plen_34_part_10
MRWHKGVAVAVTPHTRDPYCHMQIKKGGVWMGLK